MQKTKLIGLLRTLSGREFQKFREFIHSPFLNKNQKVQKLGEVLLQYSPDFRHHSLQKEHIFPEIFPGDDYDEIRLNNIISDLLQLLYEFLAYTKLREQPQLQKALLLDELLLRDASDHLPRNARRFRQLQDQSIERNYQYYYHEYLLYEKLDQYIVSQPKRRFDENLQLQNDNLDRFYLANKLRIACDMTNRNIVIQAGYECHFLEDILRHYEADYQELQQIPALNVYYLVLQLLQQEDNEPYYQQLKQMLDQHSNLFPKLELWNLYKHALNYCIKRINSGQNHYYQEILELYQVLLEKEIIFENGYLTQWTYKNIITVGIRLEAFAWTENFIETYQNRLLPEERPNAYAYNLAALYFAKGDLPNALLQLQDVEFTDSSYHLGAKIIQLKSYYELEESEAFYALIEAFKKYLLRSRNISDYRKKANGNLLKLAKSIFQLKTNRNTMTTSAFNQKYRTVRDRLQTLEPVANKGWLEEIFRKIG